MDNALDMPVPEEKLKGLQETLVKQGWKLDERWSLEQDKQFYLGMYACLRLAESVLRASSLSIDEMRDYISHLGLDLAFIIKKKDEVSQNVPRATAGNDLLHIANDEIRKLKAIIEDLTDQYLDQVGTDPKPFKPRTECEYCHGEGSYINEDHPDYPNTIQRLDCYHCQQ